MRIVVDTNILFSAMLNTQSKISHILLKPKSPFNFYATDHILKEINEHSGKLISISKYSENEFKLILKLFTNKIKFINSVLIPQSTFNAALQLTKEVDIDDTELVALTDHIKGKFWSGDKELIRGLENKNWNNFIDTNTLYKKISKK